MEHIAHLPSAFGDIALNRVGECVHTCCGGKTLGHRRHHIGINDSDNGNIVNVNANHFAVFLGVCYYIVNRNLGGCACGCRHGDYRHAFILCRSNALERADIGKLGVFDYYADSLCGIH